MHARRRRNTDDAIRRLERRVREEGPTPDSVIALARAYERAGMGDPVREVVLLGPRGARASVLVSASNELLPPERHWRFVADLMAAERAILEALIEAGIDASLQHPGYVDVDLGHRLHLAIGYANGPIGADLNDDRGNHYESHSKPDDSTATDAEWAVSLAREVAARVASMVDPPDDGQEWSVERGEEFVWERLSYDDIGYAGDPARGHGRGFRALHDIMDANELLPSATQAGRADLDDNSYLRRDWLDWLTAVENAVSARIIAACDEGYCRTCGHILLAHDVGGRCNGRLARRGHGGAFAQCTCQRFVRDDERPGQIMMTPPGAET